MSTAARRARIAEDLERRGSASVAELVERHRVSEITIRRDLADLEQQGVLRRFHGGAVVDRRRSHEPPFPLRESRRRADKQRIGAAAAGLVADGDSVGIDYGTTTIEVARCLADRSSLSVVTPNVRAGLELAGAPGIRVILTGGTLRADELALVGRDAERTFERHFVDRAVVGVAGIDPERGITDFNADEVPVKQAMIAGAEQVIVVADEAKVGVVAFAAIAGTAAVHTLVTTASPDDPRLAQIAERGVAVHPV